MPYKTRDELIAAFKGLATQYPGSVTFERIGYSTQAKEIFCFKIGPQSGGKVLWQSCIHGREIINAEILWLYANWLLGKKEPAAERILRCNLTMIIPTLNIDNYGVTRKNPNSVDLNRNFENGWGLGGSNDPTKYDYRGVSSLSELESQAFHSFVLREKPAFFVDMHTGEFKLYKASAGSYGKPAAYGTKIANAVSLYAQICTERGQNPTEYPQAGMGPIGRAVCCAVGHDAGAFLWEFHLSELTIPNGPPYEDVEPVWFPKFLPMAITLSRQCEVVPPPPNQNHNTTTVFPWLMSWLAKARQRFAQIIDYRRS